MSVAPEPSNPEHDPMTIDPSNLGSVDPLSVEGIFLVALGKQGDERAAFLSEQCGDEDRRQRVEALLAAYENAGSFLEKPAIAIEPTPVGQYLSPCEVPGAIGKLGPYEILEEIGRGGMGVVFRAHDPKLQRIVAVKALAPELARLPSARQRFLREARAAAAISHPHVVTIFAVDGTEEASLGTERATLPYLVMECIVGQTLHDKIKRQGALKTEEIVRISRQIAEGLGAAHKRGLIHRDIKPANILLENGVERVKITDFGLARTVSDGGITHTGEILGTPQCMSPEQARGEMVDQRSDLFSLGCVMYTMCTGVSPFRADNMLAVMKKVCESEPRPIAELNRDIPDWLQQLVHQLLEKHAELRVQTAGEVVEVLEARAIHVTPPATTGMEPSFAEVVRGGWRSWIPDVIVSSAASGMIAAAMPHNMLIFPTFVFFAVAWLILLFAKRQGHGQWPWVTWPLGVASLISLYLGMMLTVWVRMGNHSGSGMFVFGLAVGIFWLLTRRFPKLFIQTRSPQPVRSASSVAEPASGQSFESAAARPRSPWRFLGWMLVGVLSAGVIGILLLAIGVLIPYLSMSRAQPQVVTTPTASSAYVHIYSSLDEKITEVSVDGTPAFVTQISQGLWQMQTTPGSHDFVISFTSPAPDTERVYTTTLNIGINDVSKIEAVPRNRATDRKNNSQAMEPFPPADPVEVRSLTRLPGEEATSPQPQMGMSSGGMSSAMTGGMGMGPPTTILPASTPLADAVEVLTDPSEIPKVWGSVSGYSDPFPNVQVWIDEPGLQISLKPLDFEGGENADEVYVSRNAWGVGGFYDSKEGTLVNVLPGRYRVLVQDLDYGWELDRRGTLVIGNGQHMIHVKRSFAGQQLTPKEFPAPFRWAGKSYQLSTANEVATVKGYLASLAGDAATPTPGSGGGAVFFGHPLADQIVMVTPPGHMTLKYNPHRVKLDIQSPNMRVVFEHPHGSLLWDHSVPEGFSVPEKGSTLTILRKGFSWFRKGSGVPFDPQAYASDPLVIRQSRLLDKEAAARDFEESKPGEVVFFWYDLNESNAIPTKSAPAVRRLVTAWADGQPDVSEAELLQLGGAASLEELWKLPTPVSANYAPAATSNEKEEPKAEEPKPEFVPPAFLVPGSMSGTWRMKEPPEGAVAKPDPQI